MAEHLHGYPHCETPVGKPCPPTDVNYAECHAHGSLVSCAPSVVDGVPTGQYHCIHHDVVTAAKARPAKAKPKKKAAAKRKPKKAARRARAVFTALRRPSRRPGGEPGTPRRPRCHRGS